MSFILKEIEKNIEGRKNYSAYILKDISKIENNEDDAEIFPIVEIEVEEDEKEITFISSEMNEDPDKVFHPLFLKELYERLIKLGSNYNGFELFSGSSVVSFDDEYYGRLDIPLVAYGFNDDSMAFVLIQAEREE